jgi:hypothetical protein
MIDLEGSANLVAVSIDRRSLDPLYLPIGMGAGGFIKTIDCGDVMALSAVRLFGVRGAIHQKPSSMTNNNEVLV